VAQVLILAVGPDAIDTSMGLLHAGSVSQDGIVVTEIARFVLPGWAARSLEFSGFEQAQPPPPEFQGTTGHLAPKPLRASVACGSKESDHAGMLVAYLRRMLTGPDRARASTTFGLRVADSASIRMITDPAECERAAHAFIRERKATLPKLVYVAAIGDARWVEDPETKAGEYIAGVVFTATYDSVLALTGR
jgi:hypothetical protein